MIRASRIAPIATALLLMLQTLLFAQNGSDSQSDLVAAYQREFVYLDNEIRLLEERLSEVNRDGEARIRTAIADLRDLEEQLLRYNADFDRRTDELRIIEDEAGAAQDTGDLFRNIVNQGNARFRNSGITTWKEAVADRADLSEGDRLAMELDHVFFNTFDLLETWGEVRNEPGSFYLKSGEEVDGTITRVGRIAAFGSAREQRGTLGPAGNGRLWLVDDGTGDTVTRLQEEPASVSVLPLFIFESLDELVDPSRGATFRDTIKGGGMIGIVILVIGAASVLLVFLRVLSLARVDSRDRSSLQEVFFLVEQGKMKKALSAAEQRKDALGRVIQSTVRGLRKDPEHIEDVIAESVLNEQPALDRYRSALSVFAAVAPLLGLLGTVTGMIATFDIITQYGTGDPKLLSGGISEALITTELGLAVAIPVLLIGNLLSSWADRITSNIKVSALRVVNIFGGTDTSQAAEDE